MINFYDPTNNMVNLGPRRGRRTFAFPLRDFYMEGDKIGDIQSEIQGQS